MKKRYFLLPILIFGLLIYIVDNNRVLINKEVISDNKEINYPYFNSYKIDKYIDDYLNEYVDNDKSILIDYDYIQSNGIYNVTFYRYLFNNNMVNEDVLSLAVDIKSDTVTKLSYDVFDFDFVYSKEYDESKKFIALTFDDGPNYNTSKVLNVLKKYDVRATFFVLGSKIKGNEDTLKQMNSLGMEIGNHTYSHKLLTKLKEEDISLEIDETNKLIFDVIGKYPSLFRPSYGSFNSKIKNASDMPIIIWNIDTLDWKNHSSKRIANKVINKARDGDIILMHDIYSASANALNIMIPKLKEMGFEFVTIPELFYYKGISLEEGNVYGYAK